MSFFSSMVRSSVVEEKLSGIVWEHRFGLVGEWENEPQFFQIQFLHEKKIYRYGFQIKGGIVDSEWLFGRLNKQEVSFFQKTPAGIEINEKHFKGAKTYVEASQNGDHEVFHAGSLFLTGAALLGNPIATALRQTLRLIMIVDGLKDGMNMQRSMKILDDGGLLEKAALRGLLSAADPSIKGLQMGDLPASHVALLSKEKQEEIQNNTDDNPKTIYTLREKYSSEGNLEELIPTPFSEWESQGTRKLFALAAPILMALQNGRPLLIDEFDARFHPLLTEKIVSLFQQEATNPHHAQLIFVTHDASLLSRAHLRRDQVCLVEKDGYGISTARTLIEYKGVRKDALYEKEYLQGVYGAVPYLGEVDQIISSLFTQDAVSDPK